MWSGALLLRGLRVVCEYACDGRLQLASNCCVFHDVACPASQGLLNIPFRACCVVVHVVLFVSVVSVVVSQVPVLPLR